MYSNVSFQTHVYCQILHAMRNEEELVNALPTLCITYPYVNTVLMHFKILVVFGFITNIYLHLCKAFNLYRLFTLHFYWSKATFMDYLKKLSFYQSTYLYISIYIYIYIYIYIFIYLSIHLYLSISISIYIYLYAQSVRASKQ